MRGVLGTNWARDKPLLDLVLNRGASGVDATTGRLGSNLSSRLLPGQVRGRTTAFVGVILGLVLLIPPGHPAILVAATSPTRWDECRHRGGPLAGWNGATLF